MNPETAGPVVTFGEAMIRLLPPDHQRLEQATSLEVTVGGAELNVAAGVSRLGLPSRWVSRLPDNPLGRMIRNKAREFGVDVGFVSWDTAARAGLYFLEAGASPRASAVLYDRAGSAFSRLVPGRDRLGRRAGRRVGAPHDGHHAGAQRRRGDRGPRCLRRRPRGRRAGHLRPQLPRQALVGGAGPGRPGAADGGRRRPHHDRGGHPAGLRHQRVGLPRGRAQARRPVRLQGRDDHASGATPRSCGTPGRRSPTPTASTTTTGRTTSRSSTASAAATPTRPGSSTAG